MVLNLGQAIPGTYGDTHRPLPPRDDLPRPVTTTTPKRGGLDWNAITPHCKVCGQPSHQLDHNTLCPGCGGVAKPTVWKKASPGATHGVTYETLSADQLEQRFTPGVLTVAVVTPGDQPFPGTPAEADAAADDAVEGVGASTPQSGAPATPTLEIRAKGNHAQGTPPRPRIRAKVSRVSPADVVVTISAPGVPTTTVAALIQDLITNLQHQQLEPPTSAVVVEPMERPSTVSTPAEEHAAPAARPSTGRAKPTAGAAPKRRRRPLTDDEKQRIAALYVDGWSYRDLSEKYGYSTFTIAAAVTAQGVTPRPRGGNHPKNGAHPA